MKKHLFLSLLAAMLTFAGFTSCSNDDLIDEPLSEDYEPTVDEINTPFYVTAHKKNTAVWFVVDDDDLFDYTTDVSLMYSFDRETWHDYTFDTPVTIAKAGGKVYFKAGSEAEPDKMNTNLRLKGEYVDYDNIRLSSDKDINVGGNILSLLRGEMPGSGLYDEEDHTFSYLFSENEHLISAANLLMPNTTKPYCLSYLFNMCTNLKQGPRLPATKMTKACYSNMFRGCERLEKAPKLPALSLAKLCYSYMFDYCKSLTQAPELPAVTMEEACYEDMFESCESLTKAPELPSTRLAERCYWGMFYNCKSLKEAPELPAMKLYGHCYDRMFASCESLVKAPELPATDIDYSCYDGMFMGCKSLVEAPDLPAKWIHQGSYESMFEDCTSLVRGPVIAAERLQQSWVCKWMFKNCTNLASVTLKAKEISGNEAIYYFLYKAGNDKSIIYVPSGMASDKTLLQEVPSEWTIVEEVD